MTCQQAALHMASRRRLAKHVLHRKPFPIRRCSTSANAPLTSPDILVEEERLPLYKPGRYYPTKIGQVFKQRYQVIGKLGYGDFSTVWLCKDLTNRRYAAIKISTQLRRSPKERCQELLIYEQLAKSALSDHPGQACIRDLYDSFEVSGPDAQHQCLVHPPMHRSFLDMLKMYSETLSLPFLKAVLQRLLTALDFLHSEANIVHADLKSDNLMLDIADESILDNYVKEENQHPSPRKIIDNSRTIYMSRMFGKPQKGKWGLPILCDFGEARIGTVHETGPMVQPHVYRAPEVIFEMPWGPPVDIWNVATLIWDLFEGSHLFNDIFDETGCHDPFKHMAQIVGYIGPPPPQFVPRSETTTQCFNPDGQWIADEHAVVPRVTLEDMEVRLDGSEKEQFLRFIRSMLRWLPEERKTARGLLLDPWLNDEMEESAEL